MEDFSERKRIQKVVCLLELFGLDMGFNFTWYHYGPYSPDLTRTLFELADKNTSRGGRLNAQEENQIEAFKKFVGDDLKSSDAMELLGSLFFLDKVGKNSNATDEQILSVFKEKKPWFSQEDIANAWSRRSDIEKLWN
jgi:uncharacterized protein YwgA